jgi:transposase
MVFALAVRASTVKRYERKQLLERVERAGATVGEDIPETITVQAEPLDLQSFVFEVKRLESVPPGERERVEEAKRNLRRERLERKQRLEDDPDLTVAEGEELVAAIIGLDRALNALEDLGSTDIEAEAKAAEKAESQRWMNFLKQALGHE